jgi:peptidoglycan/LPS O-acetylase OafA/YrhL
MPPPDDRRNNFDALRLAAAASVVFSHSFLIAAGNQEREPLMLLTGRQSVLGLAGVFVFFAISGYLVAQSWEQTGSPLRFLAKRSLRIFPGLFVATVVSAFVFAPIVTTLPLPVYLACPEPYLYVLRNTLFDQSVHQLPGVVFAHNPAGREIDGPLWSLRYEFLMYLTVLGLGMARRLTARTALLLLALGIGCIEWDTHRWLGGWGWLLAFFAAGMALYKLRGSPVFDWRIALLAGLGLAVSIPLRQFIALFPLFGCYLALWLALNPWLRVLPAARFGDLSYGIYIYGWPVEEMVAWASGGRASWWQIFLVAMPATAALAFLSWHLIEAPALRLKSGRPRQATALQPAE